MPLELVQELAMKTKKIVLLFLGNFEKVTLTNQLGNYKDFRNWPGAWRKTTLYVFLIISDYHSRVNSKQPNDKFEERLMN